MSRVLFSMAGNHTSEKRIVVGTASWADPGFVQHWYPKKMPAAERLAWYAQHFETVEVNAAFYSVPDARTVERWCRATPDGFTFDVKLHQLLSRHSTAVKMLPPELQHRAETDAKGKVKLTPELQEAMIDEFLRPLHSLQSAGKLGALLLQLSPAFSPRMHALEELQPLLQSLGGHRVAVEFRNRGWTEDERRPELLEFLRRNGATLVAVDAPAAEHFTIMPADMNEVTNPQLGYLRLHGRDACAYITGKTVAARFNYDYKDAEIEEIADRVEKWAGRVSEMHVVFNNNARDYAPHAALRLRAALGQVVRQPATRESELF